MLEATTSSGARLAGKRLFVADQISCASSRVSVQRYEDFMTGHGCQLTKNAKEADILLVDTCGYSQVKEEESLKLIERNQKAAKDDAKVIVCGCLAGINPQKLRENFNGDFFSPKDEKQLSYILGLDLEDGGLVSMTDPRGRFMQAWQGRSFFFQIIARAVSWTHSVHNKISLSWVPLIGRYLDATTVGNNRAYAMTISQGCMGNCSYCVIPMAKGKTSSMPMGLIVDKIRSAVDSGVKKIILTSEDTGAYGLDIGTSAMTLLQRICEIPADFEVHILFFDPRWLRSMRADLLKVLASGKIQSIQLPIQSGSNPVLNRMRRAYQIEHVMPVIREIKARYPKTTLTTQVIAGFPGETEQEFEQTHAILREGLFDYAEVFPFSNRTGAAAEKLPDHLPHAVSVRRARVLRWAWFSSRYIGWLGLRWRHYGVEANA